MDFKDSIKRIREYSYSETNDVFSSCLSLGFAYATIIFFFLLLLGGLGLGIAKLVIGVIYFSSCDLQSLLPVFLIVGTTCALGISCCYKQNQEDGKTKRCALKWLRTLAGAFEVVWLVCGTIWVVEVRNVIYAPGHCENSTTPSLRKDNSTTENIGSDICLTCSVVLADFTFVLVIVEWVMFSLYLVFVLLTCLVNADQNKAVSVV